MDQNKNWTNWQYYNPNTIADLVPAMGAKTYTRSDGVRITINSPTEIISSGMNLWDCFAGPGNTSSSKNYCEVNTPGYLQISFSVPQTLVQCYFYNYHTGSTSAPISLQGSNNGSDFSNISSLTIPASNTVQNQFVISNPVTYSYFRIYFTSNLGNYSSTVGMIRNLVLRGYSNPNG